MKKLMVVVGIVMLIMSCGFDTFDATSIMIDKPNGNYFTVEFGTWALEDTVTITSTDHDSDPNTPDQVTTSVNPSILTTATKAALVSDDRDVTLTLDATTLNNTNLKGIIGEAKYLEANVTIETSYVEGSDTINLNESLVIPVEIVENTAPNVNTSTDATYDITFIDILAGKTDHTLEEVKATIRYKENVENDTFGDVDKGAKYPLADLYKVSPTFEGRIDAIDLDEVHVIANYWKDEATNDFDTEHALEFPVPFYYDGTNGAKVYIAISDRNDADIFTMSPEDDATNAYLQIDTQTDVDDTIGYITIVGSKTAADYFGRAYKIWVLDASNPPAN